MISLRCRPAVLKFNFGPVIGILGNATDASYIAAGARVIPLIYNEPLELRNEKLNLVNGVIFTAKSGVYFDVVKSIFEINVRRKNDAGHHFPLLAICLGFELLTMIVSECSGRKHHGQIQRKKSRFKFQSSLSPMVQARKYPVTAVQCYPEKNAFEWGLSGIPHSEDAVHVTQHVADFFVREARISAKNKPKPSPWKVLDNLIYNHSPTYCRKAGNGFDEVYIFSSTLCQFA
ncbi:PREDICTED: gamma-glutamyl hydrolase 1-like [Erythranthe guttata]|uniref:gamma-glutamyl hydrolase 1-like n=1 Tax=Erythranthe guttata TaxID=4155 RepID=UPI00064DCCD0|nr:PREDICTED: gamma-glutamyl hydrolase 1-like [Erythranthe guttata]|eukprot:XP_012850557.1 PREDICTED: gamma-glutamyl hydrolase 1-like [Erythranthe guttata]